MGLPLEGTLGHIHLIGMLLVPSHFHSQLSSHAKPPHSPNRMCDRTCAKIVCLALHYLTKTVTSFTQCTCLTDFFKIPVPANLTDLNFGYCWYTCRNLLITRLGQPNCGRSVRRSVVNARKTCAKIRAWIVRASAHWMQPGPSTHQLA